jgi:ProP effector
VMSGAENECARLAEHRAPERQSPPMNTEPKEPPPEAAVAEPTVDAVTPLAENAKSTDGAAVDAAAAPQAAPAAPVGISPAECGARLATLFPALFIAPGAPGPYKPIKLRIHTDIQARAPGEFSKRVLGIFFSRYTTTNAYLKALAAPGAQRFDLDGAAAGEIAEVHRAAAVEEIARRQAIAAERRAMQQPRRAPPPQREQAPQAGAPADGAATDSRDRPPRPPREPRPPRPPRDDRDPRSDNRPPRGAPQQRQAAPHAQRPPRRDDAPHMHASAPTQEQAPTTLPADPAQRERALLLRAFEASPLSKANFCTLKRISEADLDAALVQARGERR